MMRLTTLVSLLAGAAADCYLQYPPGSNNRLDEGGGNRNNNNRLMDTQNNAKGGYGYGGDANNQAAPVKYMAGSEVSTMWTAQHSCGSANNECQIVVQAMCNAPQAGVTPAGLPTTNANGAGEGPVRDGTDNGTPDPNNPDQDTGLHEPASFYNDCADRQRNKGLYTADQNMNNNQGAQATRQNPNGNRSGQECPEERDYYPYWHPSPWKDLAIMTNNLALCGLYQQESQNVKAKNYCTDPQHNNEQDCGANNWKEVAPFNIPPPECITAPVQRDNHLGSGPTGQEVMYNWTVNSAFGENGANDATNCVMRFRYNITTADTQVCEDKSINNKAACEAAGKIWSAAFLDASYNNLVQGNANVDPSDANPPLMQQNPDTDMGGTLADTGGTNSLLELAVNTNQYGRTFQDRTHVMEIQARPAAVSDTTKIYNLNVKGKRGNIVQTYPATEYDFTPVDLVVGMNDMVHVQWTGNDDTNNNGNNNGEGTNSEDRHNIVQLANSGMDAPMAKSSNQAKMFDVAWEWNPDTTNDFGGSRDVDELTKQFALSKQTGCAQENDINNDQQNNNCQKLNAAAATVDLGMLKFKPGEFKYMSSRNMNFSNRAQKATLTVLSTPSVVPKPPVAVTVNAVAGGNDKKALEVSWSQPGAKDPAIGFDGKEYWGMEQLNTPVAQYSVSYSLEGGKEGSWIAGPAECAQSPCTIRDLPAGTNALVKVNAWGQAGEGEDSEFVAAQTEDSDYSRECRETLLAKADGSYVAPGTIVAAVFGALAFLCLCGGVAYYFKRQKDSNVPPPPKAPGAAY